MPYLKCDSGGGRNKTGAVISSQTTLNTCEHHDLNHPQLRLTPVSRRDVAIRCHVCEYDVKSMN